MKLKTENGRQRVQELLEHFNRRGREWTAEDVLEWCVLRAYNRQRAVKRHSLSLKDEVVDVSPLEERHLRGGVDDE